jgi:hypothetical protein
MTIEIKQLVIRAVADGRREHPLYPAGPRVAPAPVPSRTSPPPRTPEEDREALVAACVREVLRKLERSRER